MPGQVGAIKAGGAYVSIGADDKMLVSALTRARAKISAFGAAVSAAGVKLIAGGAAMLAPMILSSRKFASYGDQIAKMAKRTGFTTEALSKLGFAAQISGTSIEGLETGVRRMARFVLDAQSGSKEYVDTLDQLGITLADIEGQSPEDLFMRFADAIRAINDPTKKAALSMEVFGRAGSMLIPLLDLGADGLKKYGDEADRLGIVIRGSMGPAAEELTDNVLRLKTAFLGAQIQLGNALLPKVTEFVKWATDAGVRLGKWVSQNKDLIRNMLQLSVSILKVGAALIVVGKGLALLAWFIGPGGLIAAASAVFLSLADHVWDLNLGFKEMIDLVKVGGHSIRTWMISTWLAIFKAWEYTKNGILSGLDMIVVVAKSVWEDIRGSFELAFKSIYSFFVNIAVKIVQVFSDMLGAFLKQFNYTITALYAVGVISEQTLLDAVGMMEGKPLAAVEKLRKSAVQAEKDKTDAVQASTQRMSGLWDDFNKKDASRDKETIKRIATLDDAMQQTFEDELDRDSKRRRIAAVGGAAAAAAGAAPVPGAPALGAGDVGQSVFGTFAGRAAAGIAGGGGMRELVSVEKKTEKNTAAIKEILARGGVFGLSP